MHAMLDDDDEKEKPNRIRRINVCVRQAAAQCVTAAFEHLVHHQFPLAFTKHWEPLPELFGDAGQRSAEALMSGKELSLHFGRLRLISPDALGFLKCPDCTKQARLQSEDSCASANLARRPLSLEVANISGEVGGGCLSLS